MRLLLDENLSYRIVDQLVNAGHNAVHVTTVGLGNTDDDAIFPWARRERRIVVTSDADFSEMLALSGATGPSVLHLRSADHLTPSEQAVLIITTLDEIGADLQAGAVASVRPGRVRVRVLPITRREDLHDS